MYGEYAWGYTSVGPLQQRQIREGRHSFYPPFPPIEGVHLDESITQAVSPAIPFTVLKSRKWEGESHPPRPLSGSLIGMKESVAPETPVKVTKNRVVSEGKNCDESGFIEPLAGRAVSTSYSTIVAGTMPYPPSTRLGNQLKLYTCRSSDHFSILMSRTTGTNESYTTYANQASQRLKLASTSLSD